VLTAYLSSTKLGHTSLARAIVIALIKAVLIHNYSTSRACLPGRGATDDRAGTREKLRLQARHQPLRLWLFILYFRVHQCRARFYLRAANAPKPTDLGLIVTPCCSSAASS
jgi:hypothetical protein